MMQSLNILYVYTLQRAGEGGIKERHGEGATIGRSQSQAAVGSFHMGAGAPAASWKLPQIKLDDPEWCCLRTTLRASPAGTATGGSLLKM